MPTVREYETALQRNPADTEAFVALRKAYRQAQDGGLPDGKPMFSTSARDMLRASAEVAREGGAEDTDRLVRRLEREHRRWHTHKGGKHRPSH